MDFRHAPGHAGLQRRLLLDFLKSIECETLYLVGDIVDGWQLRKGWYWPPRHNDVVRCVLKKAKHGTRVIYVPGNHDEVFRDYVGLNFGGVELALEAIHVTADGRRLLVLHGDEFDGVVLYAKWLAFLGDHAYTLLLKLQPSWSTRAAAGSGCPIGRSSAHIKKRVKNAVQFVSSFEEAVAHAAARARRRRRRLRPYPLAPRSARSAKSPITTTATGWRAAPRWSSMPTAGWRSSTGPSASAPRRREQIGANGASATAA